MSNFEKELNSRKNLTARTVGLFVVLIIIGFMGYYFEKVTIALVAAAIVTGIYLVERNMRK